MSENYVAYPSNGALTQTTFTEQDQRVLENLMRKKQKAEEEERQRKNREVELSKELFSSFNDTIKQMQDLIAMHEAQVGEMASRYKDVMPESMIPTHTGGTTVVNDGYREKYEALAKEVEALRKQHADMEAAYKDIKAKYDDLDGLTERLFNTMENRPESFEEFVIWRELKAEERRAQQEKKAAKKNNRPQEQASAPTPPAAPKTVKKEVKNKDVTDPNDDVIGDDTEQDTHFSLSDEDTSVDDPMEDDDDLILTFD